MTSKFDPAAMYRPSVDGEPDWQRDETTLFEASLAALTKFKIDHPNEMVSAFGFDSEPCYGYALIGIETPKNALEVATRREEYEIQNRYEQFARDEAWRSARYYTSREALDYSNSTGTLRTLPGLKSISRAGRNSLRAKTILKKSSRKIQITWRGTHV